MSLSGRDVEEELDVSQMLNLIVDRVEFGVTSAGASKAASLRYWIAGMEEDTI